MPQMHKVAQGEYLAKIAAKYGFADFNTIWDYARNSQLKQKRKNPNVLFPGDILVIPDKQEKDVSKPTTNVHQFKTAKKTVMLRLVLEDLYEKPIASAKCKLVLPDQELNLTTDGDGKLEQLIPLTADLIKLTVQDPQTPLEDVELEFHIGELDPSSEPTGQAARLANLGYYFGDLNTPDDAQMQSAVEEFQCDHSLDVDGVCGPQTQAKLEEVHGC